MSISVHIHIHHIHIGKTKIFKQAVLSLVQITCHAPSFKMLLLFYAAQFMTLHKI